jgi:uncharacterized protein YidB (DUF937 family)
MLQPWELEMGLIDSVLGGLLGGQNASSPIGGILSNILQGGSSRGGLGGGLGGLLQQFQQAGLGHVADSWVGNGPNTPVLPGQLRHVFGQDRVRDMASQSGMPEDDFLGQLAQHLPSAVDGMTPGGRLPDDNDTVSV